MYATLSGMARLRRTKERKHTQGGQPPITNLPRDQRERGKNPNRRQRVQAGVGSRPPIVTDLKKCKIILIHTLQNCGFHQP
jgi:hypothetical protein